MPNSWKYLPIQKKRTVASYPTGNVTTPPKFPRIGVVETKVIRVERGRRSALLDIAYSNSEMTRVLVDDPHSTIQRRELLESAGRHLMNRLMNHYRRTVVSTCASLQCGFSGKIACSSSTKGSRRNMPMWSMVRWPQLRATRKLTLFSSVCCRFVCNKSLPAAQQQNIILCG